MPTDSLDRQQVAEIALGEFSRRLEDVGIERAQARARRYREGHPREPADCLGEDRDFILSSCPSATLGQHVSSRELKRRLARTETLRRYLAIETSIWAQRAKHQLRAALDEHATSAVLLDLLLTLVTSRNQVARAEGAAGWWPLLLDVVGVGTRELARIDAEFERERSKARYTEMLSASVPPAALVEDCQTLPRVLGEFLGKLGLAAVWEHLPIEPATGLVGAEALPVGGHKDVRILAQEVQGRVPARAALAAIGSAIHDQLRAGSAHTWCLGETSVLRGAMAHFFARYEDRAGWRIAYGDLPYDAALATEEAATVRAVQTAHWREGLATWEARIYQAPPQSADEAATCLAAAFELGTDPATELIVAAVAAMVDRPATSIWLETVIAENLIADLVASPSGRVDNPEVGQFLPRLLAGPDHEPWDVRLEVRRGRPMDGALVLRPVSPVRGA